MKKINKPLKAALIVDGDGVARWQKDALDAASELLDIRLILSCQNTRKGINVKCFFYYFLNALTLRNRLTRRVRLEYSAVMLLEFDSTYAGNWQQLPPAIAETLIDLKVEIVIKFGMSLLKIDDQIKDLKILSFHHGDPSAYKGRPAGFYEILNNESSVGIIVQEISNEIDSGKIWAICHSQIFPYSYKKTAINFYSNSRFLLRRAIVNIDQNTNIQINTAGQYYKLPSNYVTLAFVIILIRKKLQRVIYGLFTEKKWNIAITNEINFLVDQLQDIPDSLISSVHSKYTFYADPFFARAGDLIRVEALNSTTGLGEIVELDSSTFDLKNVLLKGQHFSYPFSLQLGEHEYVFPEVASHSPPYLLREPFDVTQRIFLRGLEQYRIVDGSLVYIDKIFWLFCSLDGFSNDNLYLFYSDGIDREFLPHPLNPIVIDPSRARMAGALYQKNGVYYRFGQNNSLNYGNGITVCKVNKLTTTEYSECVVNRLKFRKRHGPHNIDVCNGKMILDFYEEKFSLLASYRRLMPFLLSRI